MSAKTPKKFLFICTGNICRSFMAERLLQKMSADMKLGWEAKSCGVAAEGYFKVPSSVDAALAERGIEKAEHKPQLASRELLAWCDVALTMTREHFEMVRDQFPEFTSKLHILRQYAGLKDADIGDPMGQPPLAFKACRDKIEEALKVLPKARTAA